MLRGYPLLLTHVWVIQDSELCITFLQANIQLQIIVPTIPDGLNINSYRRATIPKCGVMIARHNTVIKSSIVIYYNNDVIESVYRRR